jgi:two-component system cell cycle response regulator DivK
MTTILLVEDNEMNQDMLKRRLERRGFVVVLAPDGEQGVALGRDARPDLILMDISLPVMDGWEAMRRLKRDPETMAIPIIALTAHALTSDREKCFEAGADDYDTKPIDFPRLLEKIAKLLGESDGGPA